MKTSANLIKKVIILQVEEPLEQAIKFLQPLQTLATHRIETHLMAFEVYYRKSTYIYTG